MSCPDVNCRKGGCTTDPDRTGGGNGQQRG
jgi:hypothetical protein